MAESARSFASRARWGTRALRRFAALATVAVAPLYSATPEPTEPPPPSSARAAPPGDVEPAAAPLALRVITNAGHPTHPTWYHNSQLALIEDRLFVAWNGDRRVVATELRADDLEVVGERQVNVAELGGSVDSTQTDTNRHDVPALVVDGDGRLHMVYGGGSISGIGRGDNGPYTRRAAEPEDIHSWEDEKALDIGGGAAFDFEAAQDGSGVQHLVGQRGRGFTGSLIELRLAPDGTWLEPRLVVQGGFSKEGCVLNGSPSGCNRFAIARLWSDTEGKRLHLTWGYSEASLSGKCQTDFGFCDHDLFYAYSDDEGASWKDASGQTAIQVSDGPIDHGDPRFRVEQGHVGLFKAVVGGPHGPIVIFTSIQDDVANLYALRLEAGEWRRFLIARGGDLGVRSWKGSLVLRSDTDGYTLWTPTGGRIFRFFSQDGETWVPSLAYRGPAWSLTGIPARTPSEQLLVWRGERREDSSDVVVARLPAGRRAVPGPDDAAPPEVPGGPGSGPQAPTPQPVPPQEQFLLPGPGLSPPSSLPDASPPQ